MKDFADLYAELDASTSTLHKVDALGRYLGRASPDDAAWAVYFLAGGKPRQAVPTRTMREAAMRVAGVPDWLFDESYLAVGDLAEAIAHLLPPPSTSTDLGLARWMTERLLPIRGAPAGEAEAALRAWWDELDWNGRFVLNKLITGGFRVGVSRLLVARAVAHAAGLDEKVVAQRMIGFTDARRAPEAAHWLALVAPPAQGAERVEDGHPYPFFLAHALQKDPSVLGDPAGWLVEWKWDGIRAQLVIRGGRAWLWSRGEELVTERFPEIERAALAWAARLAPDGRGAVLDGEVLAWDAAADRPLPFAALQKRVTRRTLSAAVLREAPAAFLAYDLLEWEGEDLRGAPQAERRARLESMLEPPASADASPRDAGDTTVDSPAALAEADAVAAMPARARRGEAAAGDAGLGGARAGGAKAGAAKAGAPHADAPFALAAQAAPPAERLRLSPRVLAPDWPAYAVLRERSRALGVEGFMLKRLSAAYGVGRTKGEGEGDWWKWKVEPFTVDAVLVYAQRGHGRRASLYTDYTFAVWDRPAGDGGPRALLPFAKAYSGLTDEEIRKVDALVRRTTVETFGPVRSVTPTLVFELGFEGIARSPRHKSGIAVRFPRILRWRTDKPIDEADTIAALHAMLEPAAR